MSPNKTITSNKTNHLLTGNELKNLKAFDSIYFRGKSHFEEDGTQNYLVFQPIHKYFKVIADTKYISEWKSKGLSDEIIKVPSTSDNSLSPLIDYLGLSLKQQSKLTYTHLPIENIYIYELVTSSSFNDDPTLKNSLFGAAKLTKIDHIDNCQYSGYGVGFDGKGSFSFPGLQFGQNMIIFGVDMSSSVHIDNKGKDIFI